MSTDELMAGIQQIMSNQADNLSNRQRGMFIDIRQAFGLQEYLRNIESTLAPMQVEKQPAATDTAQPK